MDGFNRGSFMRVAALYDIHSNLPALEAVLAEVRRVGVDQIVVGGDVAPGPMPHETLACLLDLDLPVAFLRGNGDRETLAQIDGVTPSVVPVAYREAMRWVAEQMSPDDARLMRDWPPTVRLTIPPLGDVLFCHATPRNDVDIFTRLTSEQRLIPLFADLQASVVVCGHTHMQFDRLIGGTRVVNAGSVGMPFGEPGADWLLLGRGVELQHTSYDLEAAARRIRETAYPKAEEFAAANVLRPPAAAQMLEAFSKAELT